MLRRKPAAEKHHPFDKRYSDHAGIPVKHSNKGGQHKGDRHENEAGQHVYPEQGVDMVMVEFLPLNRGH